VFPISAMSDFHASLFLLPVSCALVGRQSLSLLGL
jgi:hypothetical protein